MRPIPRSFVRLFATALAFVCALAAFPPARAAEAPTTMLVIDGSGSMWGRFEADKRAKIDVIREALKGPIAAAGSARIGFTSFGHRRKSDCSDVEVIAEATETRDGVLYALEKLNPRGKGPLVTGLKAATAALGDTRPASLIVINDGPDNCQQDACAFAAEFAKSSPGVPIHMISIGVDPADQPRLSCVPAATGGTYTDAPDATALATAIDAVTKLAMLAPEAAKAPQADAVPAVPAGASMRMTASLASGTPALDIPLRWRIFKSGDSHSLGESEGPDFSARLEPGTYDIEAETGSITVRQTVTIEAGKQLSATIPLNAGRLNAGLKADKEAGGAQQALISIAAAQAPAGGGPPPSWLAHSRSTSAILPPGTYKVALTLGQIRQEQTVDLAAGADTAVTFDLASGQLEVQAVAAEGAEPMSDVTFIVTEDDPDSPTGKRDVARSRAPVATFTLPSGTYYVTARSGDAEVRQRIAVGSGDTVRQTLLLPLVPVKVSTVIAGQPATAGQGLVYRVYLLDGETARPLLRALEPSLDLTLQPGRYRFVAHLDTNHMKAATDAVIEAGKPATVVVKIDAAEVTLKSPMPAAGAVPDRFWEIVDMSGKTVWHTAAAEPKALLAPGSYVVKLESRERTLKAAFQVKSGDRHTLELGNQ